MALHYVTLFGGTDERDPMHGGKTFSGKKDEFVMETHLFDFPERLTEDRVLSLMQKVYGDLVVRVEIIRE